MLSKYEKLCEKMNLLKIINIGGYKLVYHLEFITHLTDSAVVHRPFMRFISKVDNSTMVKVCTTIRVDHSGKWIRHTICRFI